MRIPQLDQEPADGGGRWYLSPSCPHLPLYRSPVRQVPFERVAQIEGLTCKVEITAEGYTARVGIPWQEIGRPAPAAGAVMRGDVGVLVSDAGGQRTVLRRFLFNQNTTITMDAPTEAEVEPQYWGGLRFD